jgi:acyl carrier protein
MSKNDELKRIEIWLRSAFAELGLPVEDTDPDFFEIGASSLTAIKLIGKVDVDYGEYALPPVDLFERPKLSMIAETIFTNAAGIQQGA